MQNLTIDGKRLWDTLMDTARFGATPKGGLCRLTLSDSDRAVRDWFKAQCEALGLAVTIDDMGNMFARRQGTSRQGTSRNDLPPIAMGSHLDTQPTGGKFDGVLGVLAALEAMRTLVAAGYATHAPIEIVNWTNEEGARFAPPMLASGVFAGVFSRDYAYARTDRDGKTFGAELERIGYRGETPVGAHTFSAMFELHIEQGPIMEPVGKSIGIVQGAQGVRWYEVTVTGQEAHTGATPMRLRKNALLGSARMIEHIDAIARAHPPDAVGTVGLIESRPNSRNVVPGEVFFSIDFRHPDETTLDAMEAELRAALPAVLTPLQLTWLEDAHLVCRAGELFARADRLRAPRRRGRRLRHPGRDLRRRPRRLLRVARCAHHDDLRALRRRHLAQRSRGHEPRRMRRRRASAAQRGAGVRSAAGVRLLPLPLAGLRRAARQLEWVRGCGAVTPPHPNCVHKCLGRPDLDASAPAKPRRAAAPVPEARRARRDRTITKEIGPIRFSARQPHHRFHIAPPAIRARIHPCETDCTLPHNSFSVSSCLWQSRRPSRCRPPRPSRSSTARCRRFRRSAVPRKRRTASATRPTAASGITIARKIRPRPPAARMRICIPP